MAGTQEMDRNESAVKRKPMKCRVCGAKKFRFLWEMDDGIGWYRCVCGSDMSTVDIATATSLYHTKDYFDHHHQKAEFKELVAELGTNMRYFNLHREEGSDFLDVGCGEGASLFAARESGWRARGFEINPYALADDVVVSNRFRASLFDKQFDAVMCREVIEHVEDWKGLLVEINKVTRIEGLVQIQTPRPYSEPHTIPYQFAHLQLFDSDMLTKSLVEHGFEILEILAWDIGQLQMCRKVRDL